MEKTPNRIVIEISPKKVLDFVMRVERKGGGPKISTHTQHLNVMNLSFDNNTQEEGQGGCLSWERFHNCLSLVAINKPLNVTNRTSTQREPLRR